MEPMRTRRPRYSLLSNALLKICVYPEFSLLTFCSSLFPKSTMSTYSNGRILLFVVGFLTVLAYALMIPAMMSSPSSTTLLTDPFLQTPTPASVNVVWFTEFPGTEHRVEYGANFAQQAIATTTKLSRMREDGKSKVGDQVEEGQVFAQPTERAIWRHEAQVSGLTPGVRVPYRVVSVHEDGAIAQSNEFTLAATPAAGSNLKILLTSDHQLMPMTAANLQKVVETVGAVDAVFMAGDLVNVPDRASEWFDDNRGGAFFPALQGRAAYTLEREGTATRYTGGAIIQSAPLFPAVGNHEVMGRFSTEAGLDDQFNDPYPRRAAEVLYSKQAQPNADPQQKASWITNNSFNIDSFRELFTLPNGLTDSEEQPPYYAMTFGDVRLVVLYATNIWRRPSLEPDVRGRYREADQDLAHPERWGYGQHIFEAIAKGSPQYVWLEQELKSPAFQEAPYRIVMFHHPPHTLGDNIVPAYTNPVQIVDRFADGSIKAIRYEYPKGDDYLIRDVLPLVEQAGAQLVFTGHCHLWNRFQSAAGTHYLESSNVGNTYNAFWKPEQRRPIPLGFQEEYAAFGDPNGLTPIVPTIDPLRDDAGQPLPYIASNDISVFSIFETDTGRVSSYRFDTRQPDSVVVKFDEFTLPRS